MNKFVLAEWIDSPKQGRKWEDREKECDALNENCALNVFPIQKSLQNVYLIDEGMQKEKKYMKKVIGQERHLVFLHTCEMDRRKSNYGCVIYNDCC
ncbi:hypothetical protein NPIL_585431 [Nephila pilipes]|uniref:Uncharacterized protein n=1 Tax=Nephila pilipes TaxID=299642 RepID=A0A8X6PTA6_NEPPI|nr:hypothetical protein NPIL_585431 [Nephila pilipes]